MNVPLTPELEELVNAEIKSGQYKSATEVVREGAAARATPQREARRSETRNPNRVDQIERGEYVEYTSVEELFEDIEAAVVKRTAKKPKPR